MDNRHHCGRRMHGHGWDRQLPTPRRRWRCPTCRRVIVEHPTRNPNGTRGQVYTDDRGRKQVYLGREHPLTNSGGWQYAYRVAVADAIGRPLRTDEHVHHTNRDHTDDDLENLELLAVEYHGRISGYAALLAVARGEDGRFKELDVPEGPFSWPRRGPVLGNAAKQ